MWFAWNIGDHMTFKVFQCNEDPHKRNVVFHRGVVVLRSPTAAGYNSPLAPKRYTYFPVVQVEGGASIKTVPLEHQGTVDPPNIYISEGGGKRRKPSSSPPKSVESNRPTTVSNEAVVDGPGTTNGFSALANRGDVNENRTTNDMDWYTMGQEEVQYHQNDAEKLDIFLIDVLLC